MPNIYTTKKMIAASMTTDVIWQSFSQYLDPVLEDKDMGGWAAVEFTNYVGYPVGLAIFAYLAFCCNFQWKKRNTEAESITYDMRIKEREENIAIMASVFLGMMGWMAGYTLAEEQGLERWGM